MTEEMKKLTPEDQEKVSAGTDFDENDRCPKCGSKNIRLELAARLHVCEDCGYYYD